MLKKWFIGAWMVLVMVACSWALVPENFFRAHDYIHAARIAEMSRALSDGHVIPRWTEHFGYGYGMPLFEFYAPLPYYFGAFWYWLGVPVVLVVKLLFVTSGIGVLLGGYVVGKELVGRWGGLVAGAAMCLAPYRAVNLFVRGAVSEAWGMLWMPWVLYGAIRVVKGDKSGWKWLTLSLVALVLSHNIMAMVFIPLSAAFAVGWWAYRRWVAPKQSSVTQLAQIGGSYILAAGMTVFYMVPALAEYAYTKINSIFSGYFHYSQHFLYLRQFTRVNWGFTGSVWGPDDGISFFLGWGQWLGLIVSVVIILVLLWRAVRTHALPNFFQKRIVGGAILSGVLFGVALFMTLARSAPVWEVITPLAKAQFPWRFLSPAAVFLGLVAGTAVALIPTKFWRGAGATVILLALLANGWYFRPEKYLDSADSLYYDDADRIESHMSGVLPDYIPVQLADPIEPPQQLVSCQADFQSTDPACGGDVTTLVDKTHQKLVSVNLPNDSQVSLAIADFPGWKLELDGQPIEKRVNDLGTLVAEVPAGNHLVGAYFGASPVRAWSDAISTASWLLFLVLAIPVTSIKKGRHD